MQGSRRPVSYTHLAPISEAQLVETALLNIVNHQTLIATKASRVVYAAQGDPVLEFGLRRAQGPDAGIYGARAAIIGGCTSTSNAVSYTHQMCIRDRNSDAIIVLEHGRIIERGTHEELLKLKGTYYQLYTGKLELS